VYKIKIKNWSKFGNSLPPYTSPHVVLGPAEAEFITKRVAHFLKPWKRMHSITRVTDKFLCTSINSLRMAMLLCLFLRKLKAKLFHLVARNPEDESSKRHCFSWSYSVECRPLAKTIRLLLCSFREIVWHSKMLERVRNCPPPPPQEPTRGTAMLSKAEQFWKLTWNRTDCTLNIPKWKFYKILHRISHTACL
jgi:hypothetical protein